MSQYLFRLIYTLIAIFGMVVVFSVFGVLYVVTSLF